MFSNVRFEPLTHIKLSFLLSLMSEFFTVTLLACSIWKICTPSQPPQSTRQESTTMLLALSERNERALTGPSKLRLLPPVLPLMLPFSKSPTTTLSPATARNVTAGEPDLFGPIVTFP